MNSYLVALGVILLLGCAAWIVSVLIQDVSFVDSLWSLFFLIAAGVFAWGAEFLSLRAQVVFVLVAVWAIRLSLHITVRNWGEGEDYRYRAIRKKNNPGFVVKSLYVVFGLQGVLAWIISAPLLPAITSTSVFGYVDIAAVLLWTVGFVFETGGDYQLKAFKENPSNAGKVLDKGLWRYTRHPNYFGDFCVWWAFYLFAVAAGGWWTIFAPLLMSLLLLQVSGVAMLERTITDRRPQYAEYIERTNAFFPGPRRAKS